MRRCAGDLADRDVVAPVNNWIDPRKVVRNIHKESKNQKRAQKIIFTTSTYRHTSCHHGTWPSRPGSGGKGLGGCLACLRRRGRAKEGGQAVVATPEAKNLARSFTAGFPAVADDGTSHRCTTGAPGIPSMVATAANPAEAAETWSGARFATSELNGGILP